MQEDYAVPRVFEVPFRKRQDEVMRIVIRDDKPVHGFAYPCNTGSRSSTHPTSCPPHREKPHGLFIERLKEGISSGMP
jgi:hypothetical protein